MVNKKIKEKKKFVGFFGALIAAIKANWNILKKQF